MRIWKNWALVVGAVTIAFLIGARPARSVYSSPVTVENTATNPVPTQSVDNKARTAVLLTLAGSAGGDTIPFPAGQNFVEVQFQDANGIYVVPAGTRLVIDSLYSGVALPAGQTPTVMFLQSTVNGMQDGFDMPLGLSANGTQYLFSSNHTAYADPGTVVGLFAARSASAGSASVFAALYGHLESVQ